MGIEQDKRAYELLENPFEYPSMTERKVLFKSIRVWNYSSFDPFVSFMLANEKESFYARRVIWDQYKTVPSENPQTYCAEVKVESSVFEELVESFSKVNVSPLIPGDLVGIDGVRSGVSVKDFLSESTFSWWSGSPKEWGAIRDWHKEYIVKLNGLFTGSPMSLESALTSGC